jgi:hypothetical protein
MPTASQRIAKWRQHSIERERTKSCSMIIRAVLGAERVNPLPSLKTRSKSSPPVPIGIPRPERTQTDRTLLRCSCSTLQWRGSFQFGHATLYQRSNRGSVSPMQLPRDRLHVAKDLIIGTPSGRSLQTLRPGWQYLDYYSSCNRYSCRYSIHCYGNSSRIALFIPSLIASLC